MGVTSKPIHSTLWYWSGFLFYCESVGKPAQKISGYTSRAGLVKPCAAFSKCEDSGPNVVVTTGKGESDFVENSWVGVDIEIGAEGRQPMSPVRHDHTAAS